MTTHAVPSTPDRRPPEKAGRASGGCPAAVSSTALLLAAALLTLAGCGLFKTRDPLTPVDSEVIVIPHRTATLPDSVIFNFSAGFSLKTNGDASIRSALADSFYFVLDVLDTEGKLDSLNKPETAAGLASFFVGVDQADSVAINIDLHGVGVKEGGQNGDNWRFEQVPYRVKTYPPNGKAEAPQCAGTISILQFRRQGSLWAIYRWFDESSEETAESGWTLGARILRGSGHSTR